MLNSDDGKNVSFICVMNSNSLLPMISKPTRITDSCASLIDNIFVSCPANCISGCITGDLSDHMPIFLTIQNPLIKYSHEQIVIEYRVLNELFLANFCNNLASQDFSDVLNCNNVSAGT